MDPRPQKKTLRNIAEIAINKKPDLSLQALQNSVNKLLCSYIFDNKLGRLSQARTSDSLNLGNDYWEPILIVLGQLQL